MDIKETKELLHFIISVGNAIDKSLSDDGKITITDLPKLLSPMFGIIKGIGGVEKVPQEMADLTPIEKDELINMVVEELDITNDKAEKIVEKAFSIIINTIEFINLF